MNKAQKLIEKLLSVDHSFDDNAKEMGYTDNPDKYTVEPIHKALTEESEKHFEDKDDLHHPQRKALDSYTVGGYDDMNSHLRKGTNLHPQIKPHLETLKKLTNNKTSNTFNVYRTMRNDVAGAERGNMFQDHGFTSTSLRPSISERFGDSNTTNYRIRIRPGTKGHYVGDKSVFKHEKEFILHPGTKFKVGKSFTHPNGNTYTDLHIHSQEE